MAEDLFENLHQQLSLQEWPEVYMFKFIVPNAESLAKVSSLFGDEADISFHESTTGKYTSITVKEMMLDADSIIAIYRKTAEMKGVITL